MTTHEYTRLLETHDWFYEYSDDFSAYQRGHKSKQLLESLAKQDETLKKLFDEYKRDITNA